MRYCYSEVTDHRLWNIKFHPYRIIATQGSGDPSPEGLHRDGVDFITSFMIRKCNVKSGETTLTDSDEVVLEYAGDIVIAFTKV